MQFFRDAGLECVDCIDVLPDREYGLQCFPQVIAVVLQTEGSLFVESLSVDVDDDVLGLRFVEHLHVGVGSVLLRTVEHVQHMGCFGFEVFETKAVKLVIEMKTCFQFDGKGLRLEQNRMFFQNLFKYYS